MKNHHAPVVIAVTGDVGAGKSSFSRALEELGGARFDADAAAIEIWGRADVQRAAAERWGESVLDGRGGIVRTAVADKMFSSDEEYRWACGMIHPLVREEMRKRAVSAGAEFAVAEIPLLFESAGADGAVPDWVSCVVFVTAPRDVRLARVAARSGWDEAELARRESFYIPSEQRISMCDFVVNNTGDTAALRQDAERILKTMRNAECGMRN